MVLSLNVRTRIRAYGISAYEFSISDLAGSGIRMSVAGHGLECRCACRA